MYSKALQSSVCASCRLRVAIITKQAARSRGSPLISGLQIVRGAQSGGVQNRGFVESRRWRQIEVKRSADEDVRLATANGLEGDGVPILLDAELCPPASNPTEAARSARETFGDALPEGYLNAEEYKVYERMYGVPSEYVEEEDGGVLIDGIEGEGTGVLKESSDGALEEVVFEDGEVEELVDDVEEILEDFDEGGTEFIASKDDERLADDIQAAMASAAGNDAESRYYPGEVVGSEEDYTRIHPLTLAGRFGTSPSTLPMPTHSLTEPIDRILGNTNNTHLAQAAHKIFGGVGLPYSTSTPALAKSMQQKPIALDASQSKMSDMEGDVFMSVLVPGMYASAMSVLVETRKRLGTAWAEDLVRKAETGKLRLLDAGGGGAGVLAVREMLKAEWERMVEEEGGATSSLDLAEADGKVGGAGLSPPLGSATVLTGSDVLRKRASGLLENTTFLPRLPDYLHTEEARKKGKFDIIIAPHTLWPLKEDYMRKSHLQNLWGMLSQEGGVLLLLEKGIPRGFEMIAGARNFLLESRLASTDLPTSENDPTKTSQQLDKDTGMIIAPCTNHAACPMYEVEGRVKGRRDFCHFEQRFVRPAFLQRILKAKDKNWQDVKFAYLSVMRGRDLRESPELNIEQGNMATTQAFEGYGPQSRFNDPHSLSLPRAVLPPMKKQGHIILDLCTPSGTLERWTVPKSYGKQAFRDARKSSWGDLWALGAKTSVPRVPKVKKRAAKADVDVKGTVKAVWDLDEFGEIMQMSAECESGSGDREKVKGGYMRGRRLKGVRDKRDKNGSGNGRRKRGQVD